MKEKLPDELFDPEAPIGVPVRYLHESCSKGKGPCLIITRTETGWKYYCHRCGLKGIRGLDGMSPEKIRKWWDAKKTVPKQVEKIVRLPSDFHQDLTKHPHALAWLLHFGITDTQILEYKIGYSNYFDRLIFPVYMQGRLVFWQGRTFRPITKENPKWLSVRVPRDQDVWFTAACHAGSNRVVLVEDIISALKVSHVCHAVALLGTYVPDKLRWRITQSKKEVVIWLDQDKTHQSWYYMTWFRCAGTPASMRSTVLDPKAYTITQLQEILS